MHLNSELTSVDGFVGNFRVTACVPMEGRSVEHGIAVIATGAQELKPKEYLYGKDPRVSDESGTGSQGPGKGRCSKEMKTAVFIQCVGSREPERPYCSRVCCTHSVESALQLKELNPDMNIYILYRDIRTYGERESLYRKARMAGVLFIRYSRGSETPGAAPTKMD